jgi:hypothetical protein
MTKFAVWYMKPSWFREGICYAKPDPLDLDKTHILLKEVEVDSGRSVEHQLEKLWVGMQGEVWSPNGEARPLIRSKGLQHTSMSVGDVAVEVTTGNVWLVASMGFESLSKGK